MYIAQQLRKNNIAEYLLYMWQVEDLLRAYECSLSRVRREYIDRFNYTDEQKEEMTDWYGDLIRMMNQEGCREQLLSSTKFPFYTSEYYKVLPYIVELRKRGNAEEPEIETCFNALYGTMMLRLQKKEISPDTSHAIKEITTFIGMLSDYFKKDKEEGLKFED